MAGKVSIVVELTVQNQDDEFIPSLSDYILYYHHYLSDIQDKRVRHINY